MKRARPLAALAASLAAFAYSNGAHAQIVPNFRDVDIKEFIEAAEEVVGRTMVLDPRVRGQLVNVYSRQSMTRDEFFDLFLAILEASSYAALETESGILTIVPVAVARFGEGASWETRGIQLENVDATQILAVLRPLAPQDATMSIHQASNMLIVSDRPGNVRRIVELARALDRGGVQRQEIIQLQYAAAEEVVRIMTAVSQAAQARQGMPPVAYVADARSNKVIVSGMPSSIAQVRQTILELDTPTAQGDKTIVHHLNYANAEELAGQLQAQFGEGTPATPRPAAAPGGEGGPPGESSGPITIWADTSINALVINAPERVRQEMVSIIEQLDIPRLQVQVEVMIAEISQVKAAQLGVTWVTDGANDDELLGLTNFTIGGGIIPLATAAQGETPNPGAIAGGLTAGVGRIRDSGTSWAAIVNALRGDGDANILATATVVTLDNEEAYINVGQNVPLLGSRLTQTGGVGEGPGVNPFFQSQNINREDVGTKLTITPQINAGDGVKLTIQQEQSSVAPQVEGAADIILNTRQIENAVFVRNGDVLVLGGLIDDQLRTSEERVPGLGRIPGLGWLFKARRTERAKTNLMVFIRPTILHDQAEATTYTSGKYNDIRQVQQKLGEKPVPLMRDESQPLLPNFPAPGEVFAPDAVSPGGAE